LLTLSPASELPSPYLDKQSEQTTTPEGARAAFPLTTLPQAPQCIVVSFLCPEVTLAEDFDQADSSLSAHDGRASVYWD
jgi:hypothetical protein